MNPFFAQIPIYFDKDLLQQDFGLCKDVLWKEHFNTMQYDGQWSSISLRSISGRVDDISSQAGVQYQDTLLMKQCAYFREVVDWFRCEKEAIRLLKLDPHSEIKEHIDNDTSYEDGFFRIHIPIYTNERVVFKVNGVAIPMREGEVWYANFQLPHSVQNISDQPRIHLVIDCLRNHWSDELFESLGFNTTSESPERQLNDIHRQRILEELTLRGDVESLQWAKRLEINWSREVQKS